MTIKQQEGENLREYVKCFNKAVLEIDEASGHHDFLLGRFNFCWFYLFTREDSSNLNDRPTIQGPEVYNIKDVLTAKCLVSKWKKKEVVETQSKKERKDHSSNSKAVKSGSEVSKKMVNFTLLVMPIDKILMQIKDDPSLKWLKPLSLLSKRRV